MNRWDRRIARAAELERQYPAAAEILVFYRQLAAFQKTVAAGTAPLESHRPALLQLVQHHAVDFNDDFLSRVLLQPHTEAAALRTPPVTTTVQPTCPFCAERPVAAVLRPEGEGGKRRLLCSLCFTEWDFRRLLCPSCGEEDRDRLPVYTAAEFPHIRIDACTACHTYIKAIDLTRNGLAVPEVDEIAALPLDLWAAEQGYTKLQLNLLCI